MGGERRLEVSDKEGNRGRCEFLRKENLGIYSLNSKCIETYA
jgi:hypothetical protein